MQQWKILMEQINYSYLNSLDKEYGTPFYLMDSDMYVSNITEFKRGFRIRYDKLIIGYSFKTNYVPVLCKIAKEQGCFAEVVSEMEYALAKQIGFDNVIFNGPIKKADALIEALKDGAVINLDSMYEIDTILKYKKKYSSIEVKVGLRINIDLTDEDGVSKVQCGLRVGRFGFTKEQLNDVIPLLLNSGVQIISLHGHTSSSDRAVVNYGLIVEQMLQVCDKFNLYDLQYFDVGGGFFGAAAKGIDVSHKPKYVDYANCILDVCLSNNWFNKVRPNIVIEPGVSVVANVFSYVSKIFQTKVIAGQNFLTTDGSVFDVKPTMHSDNLPHAFYTKEECYDTSEANLVGSTCMEKDVILKNVAVPSNIGYGDYVRIDGVGAYTMVLTPTFINFVSPIIGMNEDGTTYIVRRRQTVDDVMALYNL